MPTASYYLESKYTKTIVQSIDLYMKLNGDETKQWKGDGRNEKKWRWITEEIMRTYKIEKIKQRIN